jgi:hypothetical protein
MSRLLGVALDPHAALPWLLAAGLFGAGVFAYRWAAPIHMARWHAVHAEMAGGRGKP